MECPDCEEGFNYEDDPCYCSAVSCPPCSSCENPRTIECETCDGTGKLSDNEDMLKADSDGYKTFTPAKKPESKGPSEKEKAAASEKLLKQLTRPPRDLPGSTPKTAVTMAI